MVVILLLSVGERCSVDRPCMVYKECVCCACDPSVHLDVPSIGFVYVCVCDHRCLLSSCCLFV